MIRKLFYLLLGLFLLATIIVGGGFGIFLFQVQHLFKQVKELKKEYEETNDDFPPLVNYDELTTESFRMFMAIRAGTGKKLNEEWTAIDRRMKNLDRDIGNNTRSFDLGELMQTIQSEFPRMVSIGEYHVEQLQKARLSADQYKLMTHHLMIAQAQAASRVADEEKLGEDTGSVIGPQLEIEPPKVVTPDERLIAEAWQHYHAPAEILVYFAAADQGVFKKPNNFRIRNNSGNAPTKVGITPSEGENNELAAYMLEELVETLIADQSTTPTTASIHAHLAAYLGEGGKVQPNEGAPFLDLLVERFDPESMAGY